MLINSRVAPSKQLLKLAAAEIRDRSQFRLIGNQQLAVDFVTHAVEHARAGNAKRVIAVTGGPGSGKSVIALSRRRAGTAGSHRHPCDGVTLVHSDAQESRGCQSPEGPGVV